MVYLSLLLAVLLFISSNGQCIDGEYWDSTSSSCLSCDANCSTCSDSSTNCLSCPELNQGLFDQGDGTNECKVCQLQEGYYSANDATTCNACPTECGFCDNQRCLTCQDLDQYLDLTTYTCVENCPAGSFLEDLVEADMFVCRDFKFYIDYTSESIIELGTIEYPYKSDVYAFKEIFNTFPYHPAGKSAPTNLQQVQVLYKQNTNHIYSQFEFQQITGIWDMLITSYDPDTAEISKQRATVEGQFDIFTPPPVTTLIFPTQDSVTSYDFDKRLASGELDASLFYSYGSGAFYSFYESNVIVSMMTYMETSSEEAYICFFQGLKTEFAKFHINFSQFLGTVTQPYQFFDGGYFNSTYNEYDCSKFQYMLMLFDKAVDCNIKDNDFISFEHDIFTRPGPVSGDISMFLNTGCSMNFNNNSFINFGSFNTAGFIVYDFNDYICPKPDFNVTVAFTNNKLVGKTDYGKQGHGIYISEYSYETGFINVLIANNTYEDLDFLNAQVVVVTKNPTLVTIKNNTFREYMQNNELAIYDVTLNQGDVLIEDSFFYDSQIAYFIRVSAATSVFKNIVIENMIAKSSSGYYFAHFNLGDVSTTEYSISDSDMTSTTLAFFESLSSCTLEKVAVQGSKFASDFIKMADTANPIITGISIESVTQAGNTLPYLLSLSSISLVDQDIEIVISDIEILDSQLGLISVLGFSAADPSLHGYLTISDITFSNLILTETRQAIQFSGFSTNQFTFNLNSVAASSLFGTFLGIQANFQANLNDVSLVESQGKVIRLKPSNLIDNPMILSANRFSMLNCKTGDDGGIITSTNSQAYFYDSSFIGNSNYGRGGVFLAEEEGSLISVHNSEISDNIASRGGAVYTFRSSGFICQSCQIYRNKAIEGGVIYSIDDGYFQLEDVLVQENQAIVGNVLFSMNSELESKLSNFQLVSNLYVPSTWDQATVETEKIQYLDRQDSFSQISLKVQKSLLTLSGSMSTVDEHLIVKASASSTLSIINANMSGNTFERFIDISESNLSISNSLFTSLTATEMEGQNSPYYMFYLPVDCELSVTNVEFISMQSALIFVDSTVKSLVFDGLTIRDSPAMDVQSHPISIKNSDLVAMNGIFLANSETNQDQFFYFEMTSVYLTNSAIKNLNQRFAHFKNAPVSIDSFEFLNIDGSSQSGLALHTEDSNIQISNSNFTLVSSPQGVGASLLLESAYSNSEPNTATIDNCNFISNEAINGSAIVSTNMDLTIQNSHFEANEASGYGGALYINCEANSFHDCPTLIKTTLFEKNQAGVQGGAINYNRQPPIIEYTTTEFIINSAGAGYGDDVGSYAAYAQFTNAQSTIWKEKVSINSSEPLPEPIDISLYDWNDNLVTTAQGTLTLLVSDQYVNDISITGQYLFVVENGQTTVGINDSIFLADQLIEGTIDILIDFVDDEVFELFKPIDLELTRAKPLLQISISQCAQGYIFSSQFECVKCSEGTYTYEAGGSTCQECLPNAFCSGGNLVEINSGFWRTDVESVNIYECLESTACLGGVDSTCKLGYEDVICHECIGWFEGTFYARASSHACQACEAVGWLTIKLILVLAACLGYVLIMMILIIRGASRVKDHSVLLRILTNYFQIIMLVRDLDLSWPDNVDTMLSYFSAVSAATEDVFQISCFFKDYDDASLALSKNAITMLFIALLPFGIALGCFSVMFLISLIKKNFKNTWRRNSISMIVIFIFLLYPTIVNKTFENFKCHTVEGVDYLLNDFTVECWSSNHITQILTIVLPCLIIWIAGFPLFIFYILHKRKRNLDDKDNLIKYGLFYIGLTDKGYYWEIIVVNLRKIIIIAITVSMNKESKIIQVLLIVLCIYVTLHMLRRIKPYNKPYLNFTDVMATLASIFTLLCGVFFLEEVTHEEETTLTVIFAFIITFNVVFLLYWTMSMIFALFSKAKTFVLNRVRKELERERSEKSQPESPNVNIKTAKRQSKEQLEENKEELTEQNDEKGSERLMITKKTQATKAEYKDKAMMGDRVTRLDQPINNDGSVNDSTFMINVKATQKKGKHHKKNNDMLKIYHDKEK